MFGIDSIWWVLINSTVAFVYLFIISKILGKKQIAQLEFVDYAVGISLGSIAAEMATETETPFYYYLIAMTLFSAFALLFTLLGRKTPFFKRLLKGKPAMLIYEGKIDYKQLNKSMIDVNDLLAMLREKDYFDINDVAYAVMETSGDLSVMPKGGNKPVTVGDLGDGVTVEQASLTNILIVDGEISLSGLKEAGKSEQWLFDRLNIKDKPALKNIILATYDDKADSFNVHTKEN